MGHSASTLTHHRDPRLLWPVLGTASVIVHVGLLAWLGAVRLDVRTVESRSGGPIPVQVVGESGSAVGLALPADPAQAQAAPVAAPQSASSWPEEPTQAVAEPGAEAGEEASEGTTGVEEPTLDPTGTPTASAPPSTSSESGPGPATTAGPPPDSSAPADYTTPGMGSALGNGPGQLVPLGIQVDPNGRDLPDTLPQLPPSPSIVIQPFLSSCGQGNISTASANATVQMRITVEIDGRVSRADVTQSSGNTALDALAACVVQQSLQMVPATTAGVQRPTDAVLLEVNLRP